jgi:hypothetical protein
VKQGEQGADALPYDFDFDGALGGIAEQGIKLGEDLLDRIEVWAIDGKKNSLAHHLADTTVCRAWPDLALTFDRDSVVLAFF